MQKGMKIESDSFDIIDGLADLSRFSAVEKAVVKRLIHTTGDPEFAEIVRFSPQGAEKGVEAIRNQTPVICDVNMVKTGITKRFTDAAGISVHCFIADEDVIAEATQRGMTRAEVAMEKAALLYPNAIYAIGNAPTALLKLLELVKEGKLQPSLVIGLPVGFVMAKESKEFLMATDLPFISNLGTKGGSPCAAATVNALCLNI